MTGEEGNFDRGQGGMKTEILNGAGRGELEAPMERSSGLVDGASVGVVMTDLTFRVGRKERRSISN